MLKAVPTGAESPALVFGKTATLTFAAASCGRLTGWPAGGADSKLAPPAATVTLVPTIGVVTDVATATVGKVAGVVLGPTGVARIGVDRPTPAFAAGDATLKTEADGVELASGALTAAATVNALFPAERFELAPRPCPLMVDDVPTVATT